MNVMNGIAMEKIAAFSNFYFWFILFYVNFEETLLFVSAGTIAVD